MVAVGDIAVQCACTMSIYTIPLPQRIDIPEGLPRPHRLCRMAATSTVTVIALAIDHVVGTATDLVAAARSVTATGNVTVTVTAIEIIERIHVPGRGRGNDPVMTAMDVPCGVITGIVTVAVTVVTVTILDRGTI